MKSEVQRRKRLRRSNADAPVCTRADWEAETWVRGRNLIPRRQSKIREVSEGQRLLGIETGATRTVAVLADTEGNLIQRVEAGPANLRLLSDAEFVQVLRSLARQLARPTAIGLGIAGMRTDSDHGRVQAAVSKVWGSLPCRCGSDLDTALVAVGEDEQITAQVLVLSGTGSCCYGRNRAGRTAKVGGWGHLLGDQGSGYDIGMRALRTVVQDFDLRGRWLALGQRFLRALSCNEPNELINWVQSAAKHDVARLAPEVFAAWDEGSQLAGEVIREAAQALAGNALACASKLVSAKQPVRFLLAGGVLLHQPRFAALIRRVLKRYRSSSEVRNLPRESVWGAIELAKAALLRSGRTNADATAEAGPAGHDSRAVLPVSTQLSPTEMRHPRSLRLDQLSVRETVRLMLTEDRHLPSALLREERAITRAVILITQALRQGGRLFYVGAGTSGRLGVLDASECPPTFRTSPEMVQGIIAGGVVALSQSVEGAEDDFEAGSRAIEFRGVGRKDVVVGLAASGGTPFVWGALYAAQRRTARTALVCFNPHLRFSQAARPDVVIAPQIGPELLTGSTRLKAGTATKMILNILSTVAMVGLGKVVSNLMVDLNPSNAKLRDRAVRIVRQLTRAEEKTARDALERSGWVVKAALRRLVRNARSRPARSARTLARRQRQAT